MSQPYHMRTPSHRARILEVLRDRGSRGVLASELYSEPTLYGRSPRNRISELRKMGHAIDGEARGSSDWRYWLVDAAIVLEPEPEEAAKIRAECEQEDLFSER